MRTNLTAAHHNQHRQPSSTVFRDAGGAKVAYGYYPDGSPGNPVPDTGSPEALQTLTVTASADQLPAVTSYGYDPVSKRMQTVSTDRGISLFYTYRPGTDQIESVQFGPTDDSGDSGIAPTEGTMTYTPDSADASRLGRIQLKDGSNVSLYNAAYTYTQNDQRDTEQVTRTNVADNGSTSPESTSLKYTYDPSHADALTSVTDVNSSTVLNSYAYDGVGNRTDTSEGAPYWQDRVGWYGFGPDGNLLTYQNSKYTWNGDGRLTEIAPQYPNDGDFKEDFTYDEQGRMMSRDVSRYDANSSSWLSVSSRKFVWDGSNVVATLDAENTLLQSYAYGPTGLAAITSYPTDPANPEQGNTKIYIPISDGSGNVVELIDASNGQVAASYHYSPYGEVAQATGPAKDVSDFRFAGAWHDSYSGLSYMEQRWFLPALGRFISPDRIGVNGGINKYEYANNDPINQGDPTGLKPISWSQAKSILQNAHLPAGGEDVGEVLNNPTLGPALIAGLRISDDPQASNAIQRLEAVRVSKNPAGPITRTPAHKLYPEDISLIIKAHEDSDSGAVGAVNHVLEQPGTIDIINGIMTLAAGFSGRPGTIIEPNVPPTPTFAAIGDEVAAVEGSGIPKLAAETVSTDVLSARVANLVPGQPLPDGLEIVVRASNTKPGTFLLRPGVDDQPLGVVNSPGKSATIATDLTMDTEIGQMFGRAPNRHDFLSGAFVEDIRAAGFDVIYAPTKDNLLHCRVVPKTASFDTEGTEILGQSFDLIGRGKK